MSRLLDKYKTRKNHKESTGFEFDYEAHRGKTEEEEEMEHILQHLMKETISSSWLDLLSDKAKRRLHCYSHYDQLEPTKIIK